MQLPELVVKSWTKAKSLLHAGVLHQSLDGSRQCNNNVNLLFVGLCKVSIASGKRASKQASYVVLSVNKRCNVCLRRLLQSML